jgi:DNA modification methylase
MTYQGVQMNIHQVKVNDLIEYDNNPRQNDDAVKYVANSIKEFGFKVPIVITSDNVIIAGHTRLKASVSLGLKEVPCIVADDLNEEQIQAFRLADNKTAEFSTWDMDLLEDELRELDIDMMLFGFEELFDELPDNATDDDFDEDTELPVTPYSEIGDIYELNGHRLMCGDSTKQKDVQKLLDGNQVDMVFTDPPYNVDYEGSAGKIKNDKMKDDSFYLFLYDAFTNMYESSKPGAPIYVCHADTEGINFRRSFKNAGYKLAECLIWVKNALVLGRQDYHWRHEPILYGWKEGAAHYFVDDRTQDTIWEYNKPKRNDVHPTMKPLELVGKAISNSSKPRDKVLDLFGGSGSTMMASEQLGRISFLMELDERFVDVIVKRYINLVDSNENCYLIRNGKRAPLSSIDDFNINSL